VKLTGWYLGILALGLVIFGVSSWYGMRQIAFNTVDEELLDRVHDVGKILQQNGGLSLDEVGLELREHVHLDPTGDMLQVEDEKGNWLYRSPAIERRDILVQSPARPDAPAAFEIARLGGGPIRLVTAPVVAGGRVWTVQTAESLQELFETLNRFGLLLWLLIPGLLIFAAGGGYWVSRRALRPVDDITAAAESIRIHNLGGQLKVPETGDQLQRLSQTLNRMLGRLNESVQRISQFTADASHELRGPVSVIRTTAELALEGEGTSLEVREDMTAILTEAERVTRLVDSLLLLARADAGEDGFQREPTDLGSGLRETAEQCRPLAERKKIQLNIDCDNAPATAICDAEAARRLFFILIDNAIKYTPEGGQIEVRLEEKGEGAIVSVIDTGIGIGESDLPHIFDRFWRADKARSRDMGGVGLGLSIARWISERHQWTLAAESKLGVGSRFTVTMPRMKVGSPG
jgi:signal transduction histidine kinase